MSSNIVGYSKINLTAKGYKMIACQFVPVGGDAIGIQDLFSGTNLPDPELNAAGDDVEWGAQLLIWTGSGYQTYYWTGATGESLFGDASWDNKWTVDGGAALAANVEIDPGQGAFLWVSGQSDATISGEVLNTASSSIDLSTGYNLIGNPYPEEVDISAIVFTGLPDPELNATGDDVVWGAQLLKWTGSGYETYYWTGSTGESLFGDATWDNKWTADGGAVLATGVKLGINDGMFLYINGTATSAKATFTK